jgi:hypothetical protein
LGEVLPILTESVRYWDMSGAYRCNRLSAAVIVALVLAGLALLLIVVQIISAAQSL